MASNNFSVLSIDNSIITYLILGKYTLYTTSLKNIHILNVLAHLYRDSIITVTNYGLRFIFF